MRTFTSSKNVTLDLIPVSQFKIDTLRASKVDIPVPTYEMKVAGGESLNYPMDEEIAKNKGRLPEWKAYVEAKAKVEAGYSKKFLELMIWEGVNCVIPDVESDWQKSSDYFGIKIPDNPIERKLFYVYNELLGTPEDVGNLIAEIFSVSQIDEEAVETLRNSFRANVQRKANSRVRKVKRKVEGNSDVEPIGSDSLLESAPV